MKYKEINRENIILMVNTFYEQVREDAILSVIFDDIMKVDWEAHLPKIYDFWESVLLSTGAYKGNPMEVHIAISKIVKLEKPHFERWLELFKENAAKLFEEAQAKYITQKAFSIATLMEIKVNQYGNPKHIL